MDQRSRSTHQVRPSAFSLILGASMALLAAGCGGSDEQERFDASLQVEPEVVDCSTGAATVTFTVSVEGIDTSPRDVEQRETYADPGENDPVTDPDPAPPAPFTQTSADDEALRTYTASMPYDCAMGAINYVVNVGDEILGFANSRVVKRAGDVLPPTEVPVDPTAPPTTSGGTTPPPTSPTTTIDSTPTTMGTTTTIGTTTSTTMPVTDPFAPAGSGPTLS